MNFNKIKEVLQNSIIQFSNLKNNSSKSFFTIRKGKRYFKYQIRGIINVKYAKNFLKKMEIIKYIYEFM